MSDKSKQEALEQDGEQIQTDHSRPEGLDTDSVEEVSADSPELQESVDPNAARPVSSKKLSLIAVAVSVVALLSVGAGGWMAAQQSSTAQSQQSVLASELAALKSQVAAIGNPNAQLSDIKAELARIDASQQQVFAASTEISDTSTQVTEQLQAVVSDVADTQTRLDLIENNRASEYLLAEVEYLLRIAIQRVQAGRDLETGLALLQSADSALAGSDDAAFFPIRRALASEIAALRAVPKVDRTGLYLQLAAAAEQIDNLRMSPNEIANAPAPEAADDAIDGAMKTLASFVTIRRRDNPIEPLLAPAEASYVRQNLRLMLEQSQLALLEGDSGTWQASLERAQVWADRYFMSDDAPTVALIGTLDPLSKTVIAPELPAIGESLNALRKVQAARVDALTGAN